MADGGIGNECCVSYLDVMGFSWCSPNRCITTNTASRILDRRILEGRERSEQWRKASGSSKRANGRRA